MNCICRRVGNLSGTLFANCLASFFYLLFPLLYSIRFSGLHNYSASPHTLITINHKRDLDIPIIASNLHLRKTLFRNRLRLYFVARDDLFDPGFLTAHFPMPRLLGKRAHPVSISSIMSALRARPVCHLVHKRVGPLLRDVIRSEGDLNLSKVIKPDYLAEFAELLRNTDGSKLLSELTVSEFLGYDYRQLHQCQTDAGILQEGLSRKIRTYSLKTVGRQLQVFVRILDEGGICLLAPEGHLSPDGRFWPVKSGLHRLLSMTKSDVRILPVNTTYDFMTRGRMRIYVTIGEEMTGLKELSKVELEKLVQRTIVSLGPVTLGQLGSEFIVQTLSSGHDEIYEDELSDKLFLRVQALKRIGLRIEESLLSEHSFNQRLYDFISYCLSQHILQRTASHVFIISLDKVLNGTGCNHWENPVQYSFNELRSLFEQYPAAV